MTFLLLFIQRIAERINLNLQHLNLLRHLPILIPEEPVLEAEELALLGELLDFNVLAFLRFGSQFLFHF